MAAKILFVLDVFLFLFLTFCHVTATKTLTLSRICFRNNHRVDHHFEVEEKIYIFFTFFIYR